MDTLKSRFSGLWRRVVLWWDTNVSEDLVASIFRAKWLAENEGIMDLWRVGILPQHYEGVSKSFRTGRLEREPQMVQLSAIRCCYIAILWVSLVSFAAITLCVASQRVFIVAILLVSLSTRSGDFWISLVHGVTTQKTSTWIEGVKTSNLVTHLLNNTHSLICNFIDALY
jgi:hypothetical protein